jgi:hypothetical protein
MVWVPIIGQLAFWIFLGAIILVPVWLRHRDRSQMQETLRASLEKGQALPTELVTALQNGLANKPFPTREGDLRRAIVLIAIGVGLCGLGYGLYQGIGAEDLEGGYVTGCIIAGAGAIPGLIGVAYLILWALKSKPDKA